MTERFSTFTLDDTATHERNDEPRIAATTTRVVITKVAVGQRGPLYSATLDNGEVLVARSRDADFDACRVLASRGVTGKLITRRPGDTYDSLTIDIERAAKLSARETALSGPRIVKFTPFIGFETREDGCDAV